MSITHQFTLTTRTTSLASAQLREQGYCGVASWSKMDKAIATNSPTAEGLSDKLT